MNDPNQLLHTARAALTRARQATEDDDHEQAVEAMGDALTAYENLDLHLSVAGDPPTAWTDSADAAADLPPATVTLRSVPIIDAGSGVTWRPWTNGYAIGFAATDLDGRTQYIYLNPSSTEGEPDGTAAHAAIYVGPSGHPEQDTPVTGVEVLQFIGGR